jgi:hypothetical protein
MKTFLQYIAENDAELVRSALQLGKEYLFLYRDKWIVDTFHKLERSHQRSSTKDNEDLFKKAIDWLLNKNKPAAKFLFVSKSSKLGMVVDYRPDKKKKVKGNHLIIITWLGNVQKDLKKTPEQVTAKKGTEKVLVEELNEYMKIIYLQ